MGRTAPLKWPRLPEMEALCRNVEIVEFSACNNHDSDLAEDLGAITGKTVLDHTGLKGKYDFALYWSSEPILSMPSGDCLATRPLIRGSLRSLRQFRNNSD
jgi:uncharacterized protein (TIGR03435 family)